MLSIFVEPETVRNLPGNYLPMSPDDVEVEGWGLKVRMSQEIVWVPWQRIIRVEER